LLLPPEATEGFLSLSAAKEPFAAEQATAAKEREREQASSICFRTSLKFNYLSLVYFDIDIDLLK
jgi:hypothetical protein